ncbi:M81 family metallopeptidase [Oceanobacillus timonensis]|uniref:M81 family metallopeptidase n=1 Tax=Oceanobacillus timonensis TaxID=1926285 RepID=UPI0009BBE652|nr:M81 family metallopeptidase [Oceanobacillus timonensis]
MKVLTGHFNSESNEFSYQNMDFENFVFRYGKDSINAMNVRDIFEDAGIELVSSLYANGHPGGLITKDAFDFILHRMTVKVKEHLHEIDGIFLYLHGASKVLDLEGNSAEHKILQEIRKITGPYMPIAVVMDPHGNLSQNLVDNTTIVRTYRHSPHTDVVETHRITAKMLVDLLQNRRSITPVYRKVPIMIGGERAVSTDEPMVSINHYLDEAESDSRILSASFHIGYLEQDGDKLGCSITVVPNDDKYLDYANEVADNIYDFVVARRFQFHYHGIVDQPQEALQRAIEYDGKPVFVTDSGDNCGAGGDGYSNFILRQLMEKQDYNEKNILVAGVIDKDSYTDLLGKEVGTHVKFDLGMDMDELSKPVYITGTITSVGVVNSRYEINSDMGKAITVKIDDKPISVVVEGESLSYTDLSQFEDSNINIEDFDLFVVKQGYISPDFKGISPFCIMSLTEGPTNQEIEQTRSYKRIMRPMFPYDKLDYRIEE